MAEKLEVYDLKGKFLGLQDRKKFYSEIKKEFASKGKITSQIKNIRLLLLTSEGRIYLQKRSKLKNENPGLYDKTVGGHVSNGFTYEMAMIKECSEELGFPVAVLSTKEFNKAVKIIDLSVIGLFRKIDYISNFQSIRLTKKGGRFIQPVMNVFYIGYYDGSIRFIDGEASGIEVFSLKELKDDIKNNPNKFTEDIKFMIKKYERFLKSII